MNKTDVKMPVSSYNTQNIFERFSNELFGSVENMKAEQRKAEYTPKSILKADRVTVVFWADGTKTVVRCPENETPDDYEAFTAALAIKIFGSNSKLKKVIKTKTVIQKPKKGKA